MARPQVLLSVPPEGLAEAARLADGVEVKLDWEHASDLSSERQLTDVCETQGVDANRLVSVHLPPGRNRPNGMSVAPGNTGRIIDFTHSAFGDGVAPEWLTVHTVRRFDYREHVERLATVADVTGHSLAVENTPDGSYHHDPEGLALFAFLTERVERLSEAYVLVDTAHVPDDRRSVAVDENTLGTVLGRLDDEQRRRIEGPFRDQLEENVADIDVSLPREDPWRPAILALHAVGGDRLRAVHLNDPASDGLPAIGHDATDGLDAVLRFCRRHGVAIVLEPGPAGRSEIGETIQGLQERSSAL